MNEGMYTGISAELRETNSLLKQILEALQQQDVEAPKGEEKPKTQAKKRG